MSVVPQYALVDGNCFYVSCERVFRPDLEGKPVVVLTNNDGCAIARSDEAKALGIRMAQPYFEFREQFAKSGGTVLSSNYTLYGDMSRRMMAVIGMFAPEQEVYSIDESFLRFRGFQNWDLTTHAIRLRAQVRQWTGIPVGVGIGPTKTLAKLTNHLAKRHPDFKRMGICNLQDIAPWNQIRYFTEVDVGDIWGIGRQLSTKLRQLGIESAQDLKVANPEAMRRKFGVVMERTIRELNGISCIPLEEAPAPKQQIISSRSFGQLLTDLRPLAEAVSTYTATAAHKLRGQGEVCGAIQIFLQTNPFISGEPQYHPATVIKFASPTNDTAKLIQAARIGLRRIYRKGFRYKKAGVMLLDLQLAGVHQGELFASLPEAQSDRRGRLMTALDTINHEMGAGALRFAAEGIQKPWRMRREQLSPSYTTDWASLMTAH